MAKRKKDLDLTPNKETLEVIKRDLLAWESLSFPNPTKILAIDPGLVNIGLCFLETGRGQYSVTTSKIDLPKFENIASRVSYVQEIITLWVEYYRPDIIVKEGSSFQSFGQCDSGRVQYAIEQVAIKEFIQLITIPPTSIRAFLGVGKKGLDKSDTKLALYKKYNLEFNSTDEADAAAIAFSGLAITNGTYTVTKAVKKPRKTKKVVE